MNNATTTLKTILTVYTSDAKAYIEKVKPKKVSELSNDKNFITNTDTAAKATADASGNIITNTYETKAEAKEALDKKANASEVPTTVAMTEALAKKADTATTLAGYNISDAYTKTETDNKVSAKADKATTLAGYAISDAYTKTQTDSAISTAKQEAEDDAAATYVPLTQKGVANGIATLDDSGQVPSTQLPSYVDDILEGYYDASKKTFYKDAEKTTAYTGEKGKIYVNLDNDKQYRFVSADTGYLVVSDSV